MIKKLIIMLLALLPVAATAQLAVGGWTMHSPFSGVDDIVETGVYVYYRSGSSLFRIDKSTMEVNAMNVSNYLNDSNVTGIFEDDDFKSIIVAYESGNMDRLYDNGTIVNLPDIKDASITGSRIINDIAFGKDKFYVASAFGLVTYNKTKNEVKETMFTDMSVDHVVTFGDALAIHYNRQMRFSRQSESITSLDKIPTIGTYTNQVAWLSMKGSGDNSVITTLKDDVYRLTVDFDNNTVSQDRNIYNKGRITNPNPLVKRMKDCAYVWNVAGGYKFKDSGEVEFVKVPRSAAVSEPAVFTGDLTSVWTGNSNGVRMTDFSNASNPVVVHDAIRGSDLTVAEIHAMHVGESGKIYLYNLGEQQAFRVSSKSKERTFVCALQNGEFKDMSGVDVSKKNSNGYSKTSPYFTNFNYRLCEDPDDENAYYIGLFFEGVSHVKDGKETIKYYSDNSPLYYNGYACLAFQPLVDRNGNLWVFGTRKNDNLPAFFVLPADKRTSGSVSESDWKVYAISDWAKDRRDGIGIVCKQNDYVIFGDGYYQKQLFIADTKGTASLSDDTYEFINSYVDQDGKELSHNHTTAMVEDLKGRVWIGTDDGVFEISDFSPVGSRTLRVNHLKVARNDGTNLADYLLSSQMVSGIAVDSSNRKWISTIGSGVYLVSENGDEILEHYTSANSILPNTVYSVACDPNSNRVYFGTGIGLVEYSSTSSPGSADYSDVYAYPNPVRPDYTGWITVTGLMENSLVKIADSAGNVFHQGRSDGGMFTWDGCNSTGERVKTGVYYVFASQNATGSNEACVTKIMVIN